MAGEIEAAMERFDERKRSVVDGPPRAANTLPVERYPLAFSGLDLDQAELRDAKLRAARTFIVAFEAGADPIVIAAELFADGIATGLLVSEVRQKAEAS